MSIARRPEAPEPTKTFATFIAIVIRNAMEGFHSEQLSDAQMKQLNPIIRNAVCTALHAFEHYKTSPAAKRFMDYNLRMIPTYWESPELLEDYVRLWENDRPESPGGQS